ncbi:MAG: radical SAM family heme chaperone HemW [Candidatus Zixiibacteriota bacterium]
MKLSCYAHVPFCARICTYCDFYRIVHDAEWESRYIDAICTEIDLRFAALAATLPDNCRTIELETLYFGGGTPTVLSEVSWRKIVGRLRQYSEFSGNIEFTSEANPESSKADKIGLLRELGANRISFGAQSFDSANLNRLGRLHNAEQVGEAIGTARAAGFENVSLDLMYGLPDETDETFDNDLRQAVALAPRHISFYALMLEGAVPLRYQVQRKEVTVPEDDVVSERYMRGVKFLAESGYGHYEISNYALPGYECRHNLAYWRHRNYIAFGPAAVGTIESVRYKNESDIYRYVKHLAQRELPIADLEEITPGKKLIETIMLSLRLADGLDLTALKANFQYDLLTARGGLLTRLESGGDISVDSANLRLTTKGMFRSDLIASALLPDFI